MSASDGWHGGHQAGLPGPRFQASRHGLAGAMRVAPPVSTRASRRPDSSVLPCFFQCRKPCEEIRLHLLCGAGCYVQPRRIETARTAEIFDGFRLGETCEPRGLKEGCDLIGALDERLELGGNGYG